MGMGLHKTGDATGQSNALDVALEIFKVMQMTNILLV